MCVLLGEGVIVYITGRQCVSSAGVTGQSTVTHSCSECVRCRVSECVRSRVSVVCVCCQEKVLLSTSLVDNVCHLLVSLVSQLSLIAAAAAHSDVCIRSIVFTMYMHLSLLCQ